LHWKFARALAKESHSKIKCVIDPACGEGALLAAMRMVVPSVEVIGVDRDADAINCIEMPGKFILDDFLLPAQSVDSVRYWKERLKSVSVVIANPPWSSEKIYDSEQLQLSGFEFVHGQYDCYVLFIELCLKALRDGALYAFIIPDSFFSSQNEQLRRWILTNTELRVVARLGEKLFPSVSRATTVIVGRKCHPNTRAVTRCFRLDTDSRERYLKDSFDLFDGFQNKCHTVVQSRFLNNPMTAIDVDTREEEFSLLDKLKVQGKTLRSVVKFGRGVEISKNGNVLFCEKCGNAHGYREAVLGKKWKCMKCGCENVGDVQRGVSIVRMLAADGTDKMYVGESVRRYRLQTPRYVKLASSVICEKRVIVRGSFPYPEARRFSA